MLGNSSKSKQGEESSSGKPKTAYQIITEQIHTGVAEYDRSNLALFISALAAGLEVGFSVFLIGTMFTLLNGSADLHTLHLVTAFCYPIGFIFVIIGRSELFTEHTTLAVLPVLKGWAKITDLLKIWGIIYVGNLIGGYLIGFILTVIGPQKEIIDIEFFALLANDMVDHPAHIILGSSILAGWLMGLLSWLVTSSQETISRILLIFLVTSVIGLGGLHHAIVGSIEVFTGLITSDKITFGDYAHFQFWTTIGNIIGGVVFVALVKYGAISGEED